MARTTNEELARTLGKIEERLDHMATKEQLAEVRQDVRAIERQLPVYEQAANRTDIQKGRNIERDETERETRSTWALLISSVAAGVAVVTAWWEGVK